MREPARFPLRRSPPLSCGTVWRPFRAPLFHADDPHLARRFLIRTNDAARLRGLLTDDALLAVARRGLAFDDAITLTGAARLTRVRPWLPTAARLRYAQSGYITTPSTFEWLHGVCDRLVRRLSRDGVICPLASG